MREFLSETLETVLLALVIFLLLQASVQNYRVVGQSMTPTLNHNEYLLVNKLLYAEIPVGKLAKVIPGLSVEPDRVAYPFHPPRRGEVIVFRFPDPKSPSRDLVKRVIGAPGDVVEIRDGQVYVNGDLQDEPYLVHNSNSNLDPIQVPPKSYFVLGDNRPSSQDSRRWAFTFVPLDNVIGRVWFTYWPTSHLGFLHLPLGFLE